MVDLDVVVTVTYQTKDHVHPTHFEMQQEVKVLCQIFVIAILFKTLLERTKKSGNDASDSFAVWYDDSQADDDPNKSYWIVHGCDGSGVQIGDCGGGTGYIEQIGQYSPTYADSDNGGWNGNVVNIENDTGDTNMNEHVITVFQHPGTNKVYDWMWAGMWTPGGSNWPEEEKPWWNMQGIQDTSQLKPDDSIFFSLYPWICQLGDQDLSWYQNAGGAGKQLDPIYGTDCDTGGWCSDYSKCYYDNEPYSNNHSDSTSIPPRARHYKFVNNGDGTLTGWMMYEKTYEGGDQTLDYTNNCDSCDDNCKNNGDCFILQRLDTIPW